MKNLKKTLAIFVIYNILCLIFFGVGLISAERPWTECLFFGYISGTILTLMMLGLFWALKQLFDF